MPDEAEIPSAEAADQAVRVVLHGGKRHRINVATTQASGGTVDVTAAPDERKHGWRNVGAFVVGMATIIGTIVAIAVWQGWTLL